MAKLINNNKLNTFATKLWDKIIASFVSKTKENLVTGKTTLTKKIKEKYPNYNLFSFEAIRNAFIESQPNLNMENRNSQARKEILPKHFITFAKWNAEITCNPSLIEGSFCNIKELKDFIEDDSIIICLGLGCINIDEFAKNVIKYDKENDYTKKWSLEKIKKQKEYKTWLA